MPNLGKNFILWSGIFLIIFTLFNLFDTQPNHNNVITMEFSDFMQRAKAGDINKVIISKVENENTLINGSFSDDTKFTLSVPEYPNLVDKLLKYNIKIAAPLNKSGLEKFLGMIASWIPLLLFVGIYIFYMRQMSGGKGGGAMGFGKSRAKLLTEKSEQKSFKDVAGIDEAKEELGEIVDFLKEPTKFQKLGGKIPTGCLLVGPPGTGKTLLARAIAGEANVPFFTISGSDFVEMFVGVGASRVRDMFEQGRRSAPCIIFIDEIDAVGRHRGGGSSGGNDEREQTLNQLLVEMDGFDGHEGVIIVAATNRPDVLDPALLRPGRFDRQITVPNPDIAGRDKILQVHITKVPIAPDVDTKIIARGTPGFSGADLANLVNEAALLAARRNKKVVTMRDFEESKDKVMMGAERKAMAMSDDEKKMTAYHEAGHALVSVKCPASDPIHKATIIPRGRALGMVMRLPESDSISYLRDKMYADLAVSMGGRVAEEIIFGYDKVSSGASSDIEHISSLARAMVTQWGMSEDLGTINYGQNSNGSINRISPASEAKIDAEVKKLVDKAKEHAKRILTENEVDLRNLGEALLEYETLTGDEIKQILNGETIKRTATESIIIPKKSSMPSVGGDILPKDNSDNNNSDDGNEST